MAAVKALIVWWRSLPLPWRRWRIVDHVRAGDEVPDCLPHRAVVLVGPPASPAWAVFDCPCGTGHRLMVNLDRTRQPFWRIEDRHRLSIFPSIDNITPERRCHFIVRGGTITWAVATDED